MTTNYREASERAKDERRAPAPDATHKQFAGT